MAHKGTVFVKGIPSGTTESDVKDHFATIDTVYRVILTYKTDGTFSGNAFVKFQAIAAAESACIDLDGTALGGTVLKVTKLTPEQETDLDALIGGPGGGHKDLRRFFSGMSEADRRRTIGDYFKDVPDDLTSVPHRVSMSSTCLLYTSPSPRDS